MSPALITAIGGVASSGLNALSQHRTNAVNRQQAEYAFQQQQAAIARQNEYNSPAQQVLRMKAAGLNPALAYGADGAMVGNQADVPAYNPIPAEAPSVGNLGSALSDAIRTGVEVKDLERRQDLAKAEIALSDWQSYLAMTQGNLNNVTAEDILVMQGYEIDEIESRIELNEESAAKVRQEIDNLKASKGEILSRIGLNEAQVSELAARENLSEAQAYAILSRLPHELNAMDAQAALDYMSTDVAREQVFKIREETEHIGFVEEMDKRKFNFDKKAWSIEQKKWYEEMKQNRRLHMIDGITHIIGLGVGASALRKGQSLPPTTGKRGPITSSHHGAGSLGSSPAPATTASGQPLARKRYRVGSR